MVERVPFELNLTITEKEEMYRQIVEYSFETTIIHSDNKVLYINQSGAEFLKGEKKDLIGATVTDIFPDKIRPFIIERVRKAVEEGKIGELLETAVYKMDGSLVEVELYCHPVKFGEKKAVQSILRDITSRKEAEKNLKVMINEISSPIVPVSEGICVLPLVGAMDEDRAKHLLEIIPQKVQKLKLETLILDFSGIYHFDSVVIDFLYKINSIMKLLGIMPICTGIRPELARSAVATCPNINSIHSLADVQQALKQLARVR
ncbi:MAG: PAS domain S-box protein [Bacillota bacterium]|nr:PAS domain S-box protein [Bacillota bacterium]